MSMYHRVCLEGMIENRESSPW